MTTDPLGDFFREIRHRIDLYPDVAPAGDIWPTISTHDLYNTWIRDNHLRRENELLKERCRLLRAKLAKTMEPELPAPPTAEEWERLRSFAPGLVDLIESAKPVVARERVAAMEVVPTGEPIALCRREEEDPFDRLVRLAETHLRRLKAKDFSAAVVDRLRCDDCTHDWSASKPLRGYEDAIDCLKCGLRVIDGYRPYYPKGML